MKNQSALNPVLGYLFAVFLSVIALAVGNLLGYVVASLQGWHNFSYDKPGAVFYAAVQGSIGAYSAIWVSKEWLGSAKFTSRILAIFVWVASGLFLALILLGILAEQYDLFAWRTLATIAYLGAIEFTRRIAEDEI